MSLPNAILGLLNYKSMTGYDLKKTFDQSINHFWAASLSQIYRELGVLEEKGCVTAVIQQQQDRPDKKIYSITETGRNAFKKWMTELPDKISKEKRDEFTLRVFFGATAGREIMTQQLSAFKEEQQKQLDELKSIFGMKEQYLKGTGLPQGEEIYLGFVLKRAMMTVEVLIRWSEECLDVLASKGGKEYEGK